jgi:hypothetical protein
VSSLQVWLVVGVPMLVLAAGLLVGGSPLRARLAVAVLGALVLVLVAVPDRGRTSAAAVGLLVVLLVADGRLEGPSPADPRVERRRLTTAEPDRGR